MTTEVREWGSGELLVRYPDDLKQVAKGADFYVGQDRHVVRMIIPPSRVARDPRVIYVEQPANGASLAEVDPK